MVKGRDVRLHLFVKVCLSRSQMTMNEFFLWLSLLILPILTWMEKEHGGEMQTAEVNLGINALPFFLSNAFT